MYKRGIYYSQCLSVTVRYCVKTAKLIVVILSSPPGDSPASTLVYLRYKIPSESPITAAFNTGGASTEIRVFTELFASFE